MPSFHTGSFGGLSYRNTALVVADSGHETDPSSQAPGGRCLIRALAATTPLQMRPDDGLSRLWQSCDAGGEVDVCGPDNHDSAGRWVVAHVDIQPYAEHMLLGFDGVVPAIADDAWIAPTATIIGRASIQAGASVFYGAVVRADMDLVVLGANSNLQDNVVVHTDFGFPTIIGSGVSVGHAAVVHGCTIEDDCLIGMNATVLNGARIGRGSLIAAGAVVLEGTIVPPRSLVAGVPGKARRQLADAEVDRIRTNAVHYETLAAAHRANKVQRQWR